MRSPAYLAATWFGSGTIGLLHQPMGGTMGSIAAMPLCIFLLWLGSTGWYGVAMSTIFAAGIASIPEAERILGPRFNHKLERVERDHNEIVIDEVMGILVTFLPFIILNWQFSIADWKAWVAIVIGFILFRIFDAKKPAGVKYFDDLHTPFGVMMDDVIAGAYAAIPVAAWLVLIRWILAAPS